MDDYIIVSNISTAMSIVYMVGKVLLTFVKKWKTSFNFNSESLKEKLNAQQILKNLNNISDHVVYM